jgi:hypothetical protein
LKSATDNRSLRDWPRIGALIQRVRRLCSGGLRRAINFEKEVAHRIVGDTYGRLRLENVLLPGNDLKRVRQWGKERRFFIDDALKTKLITMLKQVAPNAATLVIEEADRICNHVFDLLGSGPTPLGKKIDWHRDFKTGHRWNPKTYYKRIRPAPCPGGFDIKVPWELSRSQHFVRLGQAYWITGHEKYAREFVAQVEDWIENNPWPWGVNWACTMDVAIRVVNWLWGYNFFRESPSLSNQFLLRFNKSLLIHGWHIRRNLENQGNITNNHYLADLVGLIYLGVLCPEFKEAAEWREFGLRELWQEMFKQVYPDGVSFEASIAYHRLATELFLMPVLLCRLNEIPVPHGVTARLEKMLEFVMYYTKPDGTVPVIGDADNGRLHRLAVWAEPEREWIDHRYLLAIGAVLFEREDFGQVTDDQWEEALWLYPYTAIDRFSECRTNHRKVVCSSRSFENAGFFVMRQDDSYAFVRCGGVGTGGLGCHTHNDQLSLEYFAKGSTFIVDPGTFCYTGNYVERNALRAASAHNAVIVDNLETNPFTDANLFYVQEKAIPHVQIWSVKEQAAKLRASHSGYSDLSKPVEYWREIQLRCEPPMLVVEDRLLSSHPHECHVNWRMSPHLKSICHLEQPGTYLLRGDERGLIFGTVCDVIRGFEVRKGWYSPSYGVRQEVIELHCSFALPLSESIIWLLLPVMYRGELDLVSAVKDFSRLRMQVTKQTNTDSPIG